MASISQNIPESQDPLYLHFSHPISDIEPDKSKAIAIKGVGEALQEGIKGVDEVMKSHAEFLGEQMGEKEQSDFITATQKIASLTTPKDNVPQGVTDGLQSIQNNQAAYGQGKVRETEYYKNLYEKAKALRAQYPGYRDYIDRGIEKATGITPNANAYIKSMLAQINETQTRANKFEDHALSNAFRLNAEGAPGMDQNLAAYQAGKINANQLNQAVNKSMALKWNTTQSTDRVHMLDNDLKTQSLQAENTVNQDFAQGYSHVLDGMMVNIGGTPTLVNEYVNKVANGEIPQADPKIMSQIAAQEQQAYMKYRAQKEAEYSKPGPNGERPIRAALAEKFKSTLDNGSEMHNLFQNTLTSDKSGLAFLYANMNKAEFEGAMYKVLQDPNTRGPALLLKSAHGVGGDQFIPLIWSKLGNDGLNFIDKNSITMLSAKLSLGRSTMSEALDTVSKNSNDGSGKPDPKAINATLEIPKTALLSKDTPDPIKRQMIWATFGPSSEGLLRKIDMDSPGVKSISEGGKMIGGRYQVFSYYTSQPFAQEVKRLSGVYGQNLWEMYKNWVTTSFARDLYSADLETLANTQKQQGMETHFRDGGTNSAPQFEMFIHRRSRGYADVTTTKLGPTLEATRDRINSGLQNLYNVLKVDGQQDSIKANLMNLMAAKGINPNTGDSVGRSMLLSIGGTKKPEPKNEDRVP